MFYYFIWITMCFQRRSIAGTKIAKLVLGISKQCKSSHFPTTGYALNLVIAFVFCRLGIFRLLLAWYRS